MTADEATLPSAMLLYAVSLYVWASAVLRDNNFVGHINLHASVIVIIIIGCVMLVVCIVPSIELSTNLLFQLQYHFQTNLCAVCSLWRVASAYSRFVVCFVSLRYVTFWALYAFCDRAIYCKLMCLVTLILYYLPIIKDVYYFCCLFFFFSNNFTTIFECDCD